MSMQEKAVQISKDVANCFNSSYPTTLSNLLDSIDDLTTEEKQAILDGVEAEQDLLSETDIDIEPKLEEIKEEMQEEAVKKDLELVEAIKQVEEQATYDPQEAKEGFTINEVKATSKVQVTNQPDYQYTPNKKQNILKVFIDKIKNIMAVNKETGQIDLIHNSGSYIRVDGSGNVTEYIVGNYKRVIAGDLTEEIRGSKGVTVNGDNFEDVKGKDTRTVKGTRHTTVKGGDTLDSTLKVTKAITALDTITADSLIHSKEDVTADAISLRYHKHTTISIGKQNSVSEM